MEAATDNMINFKTAFIGAVVLLSVFISSVHATPFQDLKGKAYVLVLTGEKTDALYVEEMELLVKEAQALKGQEIVAFRFKDKYIENLLELSAFSYHSRLLEKAAEATYIEEFLQTDDDVFSMVLIGKDNAVKKVWVAVTPPGEILAAIDEIEHPVKIEKKAPPVMVKKKGYYQ